MDIIVMPESFDVYALFETKEKVDHKAENPSNLFLKGKRNRHKM